MRETPDKTNAERQRRYRERRKAEGLRREYVPAEVAGPTVPAGRYEKLKGTNEWLLKAYKDLERTSGEQVERAIQKTALQAAALLVFTKAEGQAGLILREFKINKERAAALHVLDRKTRDRLKKLNAFY